MRTPIATGWVLTTKRCQPTGHDARCITIIRTGPCVSSTTCPPDAYYEPNSFGGAQQDGTFIEPPLDLHGLAARFDHRDGNDDFGQPRALFLLFDDGQRGRLFANIAAAMRGVLRTSPNDR